MPLTVNDYSNWAAQNIGTEVAVVKGAPALESASNQVGFLAHFFNRSAVRKVRETAMADFTRALTAQFGATLAGKALAEAGLTSSSKLEGRTIRNVIRLADDKRVAALSETLGSDKLSIVTGKKLRDTILEYDKDQALHAYSRQYLGLRALATDALGEMPLDEGSYADFCERVADLVSRLRALANGAPANVDPEFRNEAYSLADSLRRKVDQEEERLEGRPLGENGVADFKAVWTDAVKRALATIRNLGGSDAFRADVDMIVMNEIDDPQAGFSDRIPLDKDAGAKLADLVYGLLEKNVPAKEIPVPKDRLPKLLSACYRQALNERPWPAIEKTFDAAIGGQRAELESVIVPGARIGAPQGADRGPIGETYDPRVNGYMCHCADTSHAVNLAVSSMIVSATPDHPRQLAFRGVRHGVHCAWEIEDPGKRAVANENRAKEAVVAAYLSDIGHSTRVVPAGTDAQGRPVVTVDLDMVSVSLLTPDTGRHALHLIHSPVWGKASSDERMMLREQKAAWDAVARDGVEFWDGRRVVRIRPRIATFNFGVNEGAVNPVWQGLPHLVGGWGASKDLNSAAFATLSGAVDAFLLDPRQPDATKKAVGKLRDQCKTVLDAKGERSDSGDAYKVAARVAVIAHLMGWTPCWNCKSGKDRTGEMDVECKFLGALIARGQDIPEPGAPLTPDQKALFRAIALEGGNFEVQKRNTGFAGFKTGKVASISDRLGGDEFGQFHKGGSSYVGV